MNPFSPPPPFSFFSVLVWTGSESLCFFTQLCSRWHTSFSCHLPRDPFCTVVSNWTRTESNSLDQVRRQVYCRCTSLEVRGSWASPAPLFPSLLTVQQFAVIHSMDFPPFTSIHLHCQYLRPSYCSLSLAALATCSSCCHPWVYNLPLYTASRIIFHKCKYETITAYL